MSTLDKNLLLEMFRKMEEIRRMDLKIAQNKKENPVKTRDFLIKNVFSQTF
ncbi:acetoin:2%2C6-dichlorophenolindophenol oxidoreductase subunit alpha [Streptococcus pneumoniae]|nr:acetoin:2%2C6-dichlorophenolindophenol oxidoreductase subunit alpha [Streptococcus pneumoniae]